MSVAALVLGIIGGLFGLSIGLFGYALFGLAGAGGMQGSGLLQLASMAIPVAALVGAGMAIAKPLIAGILMLSSAAGMLFLFGFGFFTAIPTVLTGIGGALALGGHNQDRATIHQ